MWIKIPQHDRTLYRASFLKGPEEGLLTVETPDAETVHSIEMQTTSPETVTAYHFQDDQPNGYYINGEEQPDWPLDREPLSLNHSFHLGKLSAEFPEIGRSLEACVRLLMESGPEYDSTPDE